MQRTKYTFTFRDIIDVFMLTSCTAYIDGKEFWIGFHDHKNLCRELEKQLVAETKSIKDGNLLHAVAIQFYNPRESTS